MKTTVRTLICVATVAMLALNPASAFAAKPAKKAAPSAVTEEENDVKEARKFFDEGNFDKAGALYAAAFERWKRATHVFNAARCYHRGKMFVRAVQLYTQYLELNDANAEGKAEARQHIAAIEAETNPTRPATSKEPPPPQPPGPTTVIVTEEPPPPAPGRTLTLGLIGGGGILALAGAGGLIAAEAKMSSLNSDGTDWAAPNAKTTYKDDVSEAKTLRTMSIVGVGIGVMAAGWGVYRFLTEPEAPPSATPTVRPVITKDGATLVLEWKR